MVPVALETEEAVNAERCERVAVREASAVFGGEHVRENGGMDAKPRLALTLPRVHSRIVGDRAVFLWIGA